MKYLCFRFDVDTHKCIRDGVPRLLKLSKKCDVKFTFFINLGQAVDRSLYLKSKLGEKKNKRIYSLSALQKLGLRDYLYLSVFNPTIGKTYSKEIKKILVDGHEIGLHGGRNHQSWAVSAKKWSELKLENELLWAMNLLKNINKNGLSGFASPGWNGSDEINKKLSELGFRYVSDIHSNDPTEKISEFMGLKIIPTNIAGEPGGVGYIEHCRAVGMNSDEILSDFEKKLKARERFATVYDHPYYAGTRELEVLRKMIKAGQKLGYKIITMSKLASLS